MAVLLARARPKEWCSATGQHWCQVQVQLVHEALFDRLAEVPQGPAPEGTAISSKVPSLLLRNNDWRTLSLATKMSGQPS